MEISPKEKFFFNALAELAAGSQEDGNIMLEFCKLIKKSNKLHNLTSIRNLEDMLVKHVLDSLSIRNFLAGRSILDVGAGAGLPSIPLAVICPNKQFSLLDANNKKVIFLNHVKINLAIKNISPIHARIENFNHETSFDTVICRSYASLSKIYINSKKNLKDKGIIIAMKGKFPYQEIEELEALNKSVSLKVEKLDVPGLEAERHAVIIKK